MDINIHNYEAYFLDFYEGRLSKEEMKLVLSFVEQNPLLKNSFLEFENISLLPDSELQFAEKDFLKKDTPELTVNKLNINEFLILESEKLITTDQLHALEGFVALHPQLEKDRKLFNAAKVIADQDILYPFKENLKHFSDELLINFDNIQEVLITESEGLLSKADTDKLNNFLETNPGYIKDRELYAIAKVTPDISILYGEKSLLKRNGITLSMKRLSYIATSVAAVFIVFIALTFFIKNESIVNENNSRIAQNEIIQKKTNNSIPAKQTTESVALAANTKNNKDKNLLPYSELSITNLTPVSCQRTDNLSYLELKQCGNIQPYSEVAYYSDFLIRSEIFYEQSSQQYQDVKLAEVIQYAQINAVDPQPLRSMFKDATNRFASLFIDDRRSVALSKQDSKIDFWNVAEAGIYTYNNLTKKDVELDLLKNESGDVVAYQLKSDIININRDIKERE